MAQRVLSPSRMTIIAATDFSEPASEACRVAAHLAHVTHEPVDVVHVREGDETNFAVPTSTTPAEDRLHAVAEEARGIGAVAMCTMLGGPVVSSIADAATMRHAHWIVTGFLGRRFPARWLVGSTTEKLCRVSKVPVIVVREGRKLIAWLERQKPLEVVVGVDLTPKDIEVARFVGSLRRIGPCNVTAVHIAWPPALHPRYGVHRPMDLVTLDPEVERAAVAEIAVPFASLPGEGTFRAVAQVGWGKVDDRLASYAKESGADLLVVASPDRGTLDRLWHGSVSRGAIHLSTTNVACVPLPRAT